jgi:hypothetical protein
MPISNGTTPLVFTALAAALSKFSHHRLRASRGVPGGDQARQS